MTEYCRESGILAIYQTGTHKFLLKPKTQEIQATESERQFLRNSGLGVHGIQQAEMDEAVTASDIQEARRRAIWLSYTNLRYEKAKPSPERNPEQLFTGGWRHLKKAIDMEYKYLIYKINKLSV